MNKGLNEIVKAIDEEIASLKMDLVTLERARNSLSTVNHRPNAATIKTVLPARKARKGKVVQIPQELNKRGRPKAAGVVAPPAKKRGLTPEGRKRISDAMKARHAARKATNAGG